MQLNLNRKGLSDGEREITGFESGNGGTGVPTRRERNNMKTGADSVFWRISPLLNDRQRSIFMCETKDNKTEKRIAVISILVSDRASSEKVNALLSEYGDWILGRMGIPYKEKGVSVLSVVLDAPVEITNALTGKIGKIEGVTVKALFGKI